jgi:DNA-directed RNA polymerase alpha subunit
MKNKKEILDFIGVANYEGNDLGTYMYANRPNGTRDIIGIVYGYSSDLEKNEGKLVAELFQDELGKFIVEAINEKIHKEVNKDYKFIDYNLSVRLLNCLYEHKFRSPIELIKYTKNDIIGLRNFGIKSQEELFKFMNEYGFKFKSE